MALMLSSSHLDKIKEHAVSAYPEESCGILVGKSGKDRHVTEVFPVRNAYEGSRRRRYAIDPREVLALERHAAQSGLQIIGFYHSHPDAPAKPSTYDRDRAWPWYSYLIVSVERGHISGLSSWILGDDQNTFNEEDVILV